MERGSLSFLVFSASLRAGSLNSRLANLAADTMVANGAEVNRASMADFDMPSFDSDVEAAGNFPSGAVALRERLQACDGFVISSPEYNASMPGVIKNAIDWVSRFRPQPFNELHGLLMSASPSMVGGNRGLWALRVPLEHLGARVFPDMFSLAQAHTALNDAGQISNPELQRRFEENVTKFMNLVEASKHYPCVKKAWVEHLGQHPEPVLDRVE